MTPIDDTTLQEAIMQKGKTEHTCGVHDALVIVVATMVKRIKRLEIIGLMILATTAGLAGKDLILPLLLKMMGP